MEDKDGRKKPQTRMKGRLIVGNAVAWIYPSDTHRHGMAITSGDTVTIEYVGRFEDGTVFDTTKRSVAIEAGLIDEAAEHTFEPLSIEVGTGELIEGFDDALIGLKEGVETTFTIDPEAGYGEWDEELVREFERDEISRLVGNQDIEEGTFLQTQTGTLQEVVHVDDEVVRVDFNHRLAGETLEFEIEILSID